MWAGLSLLGEVFRRAGWEVTEAPSHSREELVSLLASQHYHIVGFSMSCTDLFDALKRDIDLVRGAGAKALPKVMVGGPAFVDRADLIEGLSADGYAPDIHAALALAQGLLDEMKGVSPQ
jgi:methanogenic corrinoid protein MtbC1